MEKLKQNQNILNTNIIIFHNKPQINPQHIIQVLKIKFTKIFNSILKNKNIKSKRIFIFMKFN